MDFRLAELLIYWREQLNINEMNSSRLEAKIENGRQVSTHHVNLVSISQLCPYYN